MDIKNNFSNFIKKLSFLFLKSNSIKGISCSPFALSKKLLQFNLRSHITLKNLKDYRLWIDLILRRKIEKKWEKIEQFRMKNWSNKFPPSQSISKNSSFWYSTEIWFRWAFFCVFAQRWMYEKLWMKSLLNWSTIQ